MSKERIALLEKLKGWTWDNLKGTWDDKYEMLLKSLSENKSISIFNGKDAKELSRWVGNQRNQFKNGELSNERYQKLNSLKGWSWDPLQEIWDQRIKNLKEYIAKNGDLSKHKPKRETELGNWIRHQIAKYNSGRMPKEQYDDLNKIDGWTWGEEKK